MHRDLTPSNIVVEADSHHSAANPSAPTGTSAAGVLVKLVDFGLARQRPNATVMDSFVGTLSYTSPEVVQYEGYTDKVDIWSLGCIVYQMITGSSAVPSLRLSSAMPHGACFLRWQNALMAPEPDRQPR